jgi:hypothetical protein
MTAGEIKELNPEARTHVQWLKEIAYQLAVMNEDDPEPVIPPETPVKRVAGRPPRIRE